MSASFITLPMRVAVQNRHRKQAVYRIRIVMRAGDRTSRITLSGPAFATNSNLPAAFLRSVATSSRGGTWRATIERPNTHALVARAFSRVRLILNFPGSLSRWSFRTLIKSLQKSLSVQFVLPSPDLSLLAIHVPKHEAEDALGHGKISRSHG